MKNVFKILIISLALTSPFTVLATIKNIDNAGFVPGQIWFSKYPVFVDNPIKIYTALYNNSDYDISGELQFLNNNILIGIADFEMLANSGAKDVWIDWVAQKGDIEIEVKIQNFSIIDNEKQLLDNVDFENQQIAKSKLFVDYDNDNDGIGNIVDTDDDNDGKSDLAEIAEGSNPFEADQDMATSSSDKKSTSDMKGDEKNVMDKIDDSVMGLLNKITQNKVDKFIDNLSKAQLNKLKNKKSELKNKISNTLYKSLDNLVKLETIKSTSTASTTAIALNPPDLTITSEYLPKDLNNEKIKNKIIVFFKSLFSRVYLFVVNILIFLLSHTTFLFLLIFLITYLSIKKIFRFFIR